MFTLSLIVSFSTTLIVSAAADQIKDALLSTNCHFGGEFYPSFQKCLRNMHISTFPEAQYFCSLFGGSLPCISSGYQNLVVTKHIYDCSMNPDLNFWIGNSVANPSCVSEYTNWDNNSRSFNNSLCVQMNKNTLKWYSVPCTSKNFFLCVYSPTKECDSGWYLYGESCFSVTTAIQPKQGFNWMEAAEYCFTRYSQSAYLTSILSQKENDFLAALIQSTSPDLQDFLWIGAYDVEEQPYKWADGNSLVFNNWALFEPNTDGAHKCGMIQGSISPQADYLFQSWYSRNCSLPLPGFICRYDLS